MTKKSRSTKTTKQKSSVSITDPAMFTSPTPSSTHTTSSITSSTTTISDGNSNIVTTTITEQSSSSTSSSLKSIQKSTKTSTKISPALTVKIMEEESTVETRGGLSSSVTDTTLADIDDEDYAEAEEENNDITKIGSSSQISKMDEEYSRKIVDEKEQEAEEEELKREARDSWEREQTLKGYDMKGRDWVILGAVTATSLTVRMWNIQAPGEIVMDEAHVGKYVNGYLTKEFMFDRHPPLSKMLLAGISSIASGYTGSFAFDDIGDVYPKEFPIVAMRATMALMGALCAPIAFITLKSIGQGVETAAAAALLIAFDNALTANNRLMTLDAPLMFFTSLSLMAWSMFAKQSYRPFSAIWWTWLTITGIASSCALSTKAGGLFTYFTIGALALMDSLSLASTRSISRGTAIKHFVSRSIFIFALPIASYILLFYIHFEHQIYRPSDLRSPQSDYDFNQITHQFRNSLFLSPFNKPDPSAPLEPDQEPMWKDIVYGSVIQLRSEVRPALYLHSFARSWPQGSRQQQVSGYEYPDLNTNWIISRVPTDKEKAAGQIDEIPTRLRYVRHGDIVKLRHVPTRKCLHSHNVRVMGRNNKDRYNEVTAYGSPGVQGDSNDWWVIEIVNGEQMTKWPAISPKVKVAALEISIRFKHKKLKCYLSVTNGMLPDSVPGGSGRRELTCLKGAKVNDKSIWRITLNDHDYLPADTELASYPKMTFSQKFKQLHKLMIRTPRAFEQLSHTSGSSHAILWPLALSKNIVDMWRKAPAETAQEPPGVQQISLVANPIVWPLGVLGVLAYLTSHVIIMFREKRGYVSQGPILEFKQRELSSAGVLFTSWAISYLPYIFLSAKKHHLTTHHYFPALYFSVLLSCTLLSGLSRQILPGVRNGSNRVGVWMGLSVVTMAVFIQLSPLTYGTKISPQRYESLERWIYRKPSQRPSVIASKEYYGTRNETGAEEMIAGWSLLFSQNLVLQKPKPRELAPVLSMYFPKPTDPLPRDDIFMTPSQRPPQLWEINEQKGKPNPYQRQQMNAIYEMIQAEKEEQEKIMNEEKEKQQQQQKTQTQTLTKTKPLKSAPVNKVNAKKKAHIAIEEVEDKDEKAGKDEGENKEEGEIEEEEEEDEEEEGPENLADNMEGQVDQLEDHVYDQQQQQLKQQQLKQQQEQEYHQDDQDLFEIANVDHLQSTPDPDENTDEENFAIQNPMGMGEFTPENMEVSRNRHEAGQESRAISEEERLNGIQNKFDQNEIPVLKADKQLEREREFDTLAQSEGVANPTRRKPGRFYFE